ncbi:MAG: transketolase [Myxococcales bacterium]|nr:transketolase [Myxococcales bacterium]
MNNEQVAVDTIRTLSMDAIQAANSGHPGMPMGMADAAVVLWGDYLVTDPKEPLFPDRDRFVLSAGHGSMLLYSLLHLSGHDLSLEELKSFRQLHSQTPGHPEVGETAGVETTTGPLGQGFGNAVGMAMAEARLASLFNREGFPIVDHYTYVIAGDGCLMEGVCAEAASFAGHQGLGKLIVLWDDNSITIDGDTDLAISEDEGARFAAYGWQVLACDAHDRADVRRVLEAARADGDRPTLICAKSHIGFGSPNKQDTASAHGSPLGEDEIRLVKEGMGWDPEAQFLVPQEARAHFDGLGQRGQSKRQTWEAGFRQYEQAYPDLARSWRSIQEGDGLPENLADLLPRFEGVAKQATRASNGDVINALAPVMPNLWGGSADLAGSNKTLVNGASTFQRNNRGGRNLHFGIREHGMAAIMNGMALHGGVIPYGGTFLTFSDYMRGAMRLSALMKQRVIYVLTHDSIFLGEDGPTHQSVEHAMALRMIPGMQVLRPGDPRETAACWGLALRSTDRPTALLLTRQGLPALEGTEQSYAGVARGGYILSDSEGEPELILIGTGSELQLCEAAAAELRSEGRRVRVVSMPGADRFLAQDEAERERVLPAACRKRLSVEAGVTWGWERFVGLEGRSIGIDGFGASAPAEDLAEHFGFTVANVLSEARSLLD